jgi:probable HAF family extracellular repeat protein
MFPVYKKIYSTFLILTALFSSVSYGVGRAQPRYTVKSIGSLGPDTAIGDAINNSGEVTGGPPFAARTPASDTHAFLYDGTTLHDLGPAGNSLSIGLGINDLGNVAGVASGASNSSQAFFYDGTSMHNLGTLGGINSVANGINGANKIVGWSEISTVSPYAHAFVYDGAMHDLGTLGGPNSSASGINLAGMVAGDSDTTTSHHAFLYDGTSFNDVGTLGGSQSFAAGINGAGHFTGYADTAGNTGSHAFLYDGTMHDLGTLGGTASRGYGINDSGHVVGSSSTSAGPNHAFFFDGSTLYDLNNLIVDSSVIFDLATGINNSDEIVANGTDPATGIYGPYLLTPVPPPAISNASASPNVLSPPNHKFVNLTIGYTITSVVPAVCSLSVASNESGSNEWTVVDANHVLLLADRNTNGSGRIYTITISCTNAAATTTSTTRVTVPHDQGN